MAPEVEASEWHHLRDKQIFTETFVTKVIRRMLARKELLVGRQHLHKEL